VRSLILAALVGVLHVHHAPSHDSRAPFEELIAAAHAAKLDFVVLTEHAEAESGPLPAAERAGVHTSPDGHRVLVLVGAELGTQDGHLLAFDVRELVPARGLPGRTVVDAIHAQGGFAVVSHPLTYGGWSDWSAAVDGLEVQNNAAAFRRITGPLLPFRVLRFASDPDAALRAMLVRPAAELELWDRLTAEGRRIHAFAGSDVHQNISLLGWRLDRYERMFRTVQTVCPDGPLEPAALWAALRAGRCHVHFALLEAERARAREVVLPSGRRELQLDGGTHVLEIHPLPAPEPQGSRAILPSP
jgi:hypothetical protein